MWTWLLSRPPVNATPFSGVVTPVPPYTDWIFWHFHVLLPRAVA
jgi:hypothetical protein